MCGLGAGVVWYVCMYVVFVVWCVCTQCVVCVYGVCVVQGLVWYACVCAAWRTQSPHEWVFSTLSPVHRAKEQCRPHKCDAEQQMHLQVN